MMLLPDRLYKQVVSSISLLAVLVARQRTDWSSHDRLGLFLAYGVLVQKVVGLKLYYANAKLCHASSITEVQQIGRANAAKCFTAVLICDDYTIGHR